MSFLMRGRSSWWHHDQTHLPAPEPAPEPVTQATGLPVAAPAPADGTDALSATETLAVFRAIALRQDERPRAEPTEYDVLRDGTPADRQWVTAELGRLERLATLTRQHGPWEAARRMWVPVPRPPSTSSTNVTYWATLRGQR